MRKRFLKGLKLAIKIDFHILVIGIGIIFTLFCFGSKGIGGGIFFGIYYFGCYLLVYKMWKNLYAKAKKKAMDKSTQL